MNEIVLPSAKDLAPYEQEWGLQNRVLLAVEKRDGRSYQKWSCQMALDVLERVVKAIQAVAMTVFTLCLALLSTKVRVLWSEVLEGRQTVIVLSPFNPKGSPVSRQVPNSSFKKAVAPVYSGLRAEEGEGKTLSYSWAGLFSSSSSEASDSSGPDSGFGSESSSSSSESEGGEDELDFGLEDYSGGDLLAALNMLRPSLVEEAEDPSKHPLYASLHKQRRALKDAFQEQRGGVPEPLFTDFLAGCREVYKNQPAWNPFREQYDDYETGSKSIGDAKALFYTAVRLLKDFKVAVDIEKVRAKILRPVKPEVRGDVFATKKPGEIKKQELTVLNYPLCILSAKGVRPTMEDEDLADRFFLEKQGERLSIPCFAVFDGHAGNNCSLFLKHRLIGFVSRELELTEVLDDLSITNAIRIAFAKANSEFLSQDPDECSGSTALLAMVIGGALFVASTGDSRCVLSDGGEVVQLSDDAKPGKPAFRKGVLSRGGQVKGERVGGILGTARAFGDRFVPAITARPMIRKYILPKDADRPQRLILGCDGLFDVVGSKEAVDCIQGCKTPLEGAERLFNLAFARGTKDNVTLMVVNLA